MFVGKKVRITAKNKKILVLVAIAARSKFTSANKKLLNIYIWCSFIVYATKNFLLNKNQYVCGEVVYLATKATSVNHSAHIC